MMKRASRDDDGAKVNSSNVQAASAKIRLKNDDYPTEHSTSSRTDELQSENGVNIEADKGEASTSEDTSGRDLMSLPSILEGIQEIPTAARPVRSLPRAYAVDGISADPSRTAGSITYGSLTYGDQAASRGQFQIDDARLVVADEENILADGDGSYSSSHAELIEGKLMDIPSMVPRTHGWILIFGCAVMVVVAVVLALVFIDGHSDEPYYSDTNTTDSNAPVQVIHHPPFQDDLPAAVIRAIDEDRDSAFYKANEWIMSDPNLHRYSPERNRQRYYMAMLYYATNGHSWLDNTNWLSYDVSECQWFSRSSFPPTSPYFESNVCHNDTVVNLSLASNNLTGVWPIYYTSFIPALRVFDIDSNNVGGALPVFYTTPFIEVIIFSNNPLIGVPIVNAGAIFDRLLVVRADGTSIRANNQGAFPKITPVLEVYNGTGPDNDGNIWPAWGLLTNLVYFGIGHKASLTGTIPSELGSMTALREMDMSSLPKIHGTIPSELGRLTQLTKLDLSETPVTGTVPAGLCQRVEEGFLDLLADCGGLLTCCSV